MKKFKNILLFLLSIPIVTVGEYKLPDKLPNTYVFDYTGNTLTKGQIQDLNTKIKMFEDSSSIQIAIIILKTLDGNAIEDVSLQFARQWGVGQKGQENGLVYVLVPSEHQARMEVAGHLQGDLTDMECNEIQDNIKPFYRHGDFYAGINSLLSQVQTALKPDVKEQKGEFDATQKADHSKLPFTLVFVFIAFGILFILVLFVAHRYEEKKEKEEETTSGSESMLPYYSPPPMPKHEEKETNTSEETSIIPPIVTGLAMWDGAIELLNKKNDEENDNDDELKKKRKRDDDDDDDDSFFGGSSFGGSDDDFGSGGDSFGGFGGGGGFDGGGSSSSW